MIDSTEPAYASWLESRIRQWVPANREQYDAIRAEVWAAFRPEESTPMPEKGTMRRKYLDAATVEAIRVRNGWMSEREWRKS